MQELAAPLVEPAVCEAGDVFGAFKRESFLVRHALSSHPLFELGQLAALAARTAHRPGYTYWQNGRVQVEDGWRALGPQQSLQETIAGIQDNDSLVILKHVDRDRVFGPVMRDVLNATFERLPERERADITVGDALIFLTSPRRKTAYHLDLETSLLLQVAGDKDMHVFNRVDGIVVSDVELEQHCAGEHSAAVYRPHDQPRARVYALRPGLGVHLPSLAPHWAQNGNSVSISININFDHRSVHHQLKHIYRINHALRRLGVTPTPPSVSAWRDLVKHRLGASELQLRNLAKRIVKGRPPGEAFPEWSPPREAVRGFAN